MPEEVQGECYTCGEDDLWLCHKSKRRCGHHCNHVWTHDHCHWCNKEFGEEGEEIYNDDFGRGTE